MKHTPILLITALLLTACGEKPVTSKTEKSTAPVQNTAPQYVVKISGVVEPGVLTEPLIFEMVYAALNPKCAQVDNWFEGVTTPPLIKKSFIVKPDNEWLENSAAGEQITSGMLSMHVDRERSEQKDARPREKYRGDGLLTTSAGSLPAGRYHLSIPLDFYQPGTCDWEPYYLTYQSGLKQKNDSPLPIDMMVSAFSSLGRRDITALKKEEWVCKVKDECQLKRARQDVPKLFGNKNYSLEVDVVKLRGLLL